VLRRISGFKAEDVLVGEIEVGIEEFHNWCLSPNIVRMRT
jgi:hypothetical protein